MTALDTLREVARQRVSGDDRYTGEYPYALELRSPDGNAVFVFPLGPQSISVDRTFRQSTTATLGGIVAEERGIAWFDLSISGDFGLSPKAGTDTTSPTGVAGEPGFGFHDGTTTLSGPLWTRRMVRHILDRYAELKGDPDKAASTFLYWHNFKDSEHFLIVPESFRLERSAGARMRYPFQFQARVIGLGEAVALPAGRPQTSIAKAVGKLGDAIGSARNGLVIARSAIDEVSGVLGEVRYYAAGIDNTLDDVGRVFTATESLVEGAELTVGIGATFIASVAGDLEAVADLLDEVLTLPRDVAATYRNAADGLLAVAASFKARESEDHTRAVLDAQANAAGVSALTDAELAAAAAAGPARSAQDLAGRGVSSGAASRRTAGVETAQREYGSYSGFRPYVIQRGDTIQTIAAREMGSPDAWADLVLANALKPPYLSPGGGRNVARPGDRLAIPVTTAAPSPGVLRQRETPVRLYGRDLKVAETRASRFGRPAVDLAIDTRTRRDIATIGGVGNLQQALQLRVWTQVGTSPIWSDYGFPNPVGTGVAAADRTAVQLAFRSAILGDSRVSRVLAMRLTIDADRLDVDATVLPVGAAEPFVIEAAVS